MKQHNLPIDPTNGAFDIEALLAQHRAIFGDTRMDGEGDGDTRMDGEGDGDAGDNTGDDGNGDQKDADTGKRYEPPATQADLDRIIQARLAQERKRYADYDALREKAERHDALERELMSDKDRAVEDAREAAWQAAMATTVPRVIAAEFRAEAKGLLDQEQLDALLEDVDFLKYATDDGEPDTERIRKKIAVFAPKEPEKRRGPSPHGQGYRPGSAPSGNSLAAGRERYQQRHNRTAT